jgi:hypothetical protein
MQISGQSLKSMNSSLRFPAAVCKDYPFSPRVEKWGRLFLPTRADHFQVLFVIEIIDLAHRLVNDLTNTDKF